MTDLVGLTAWAWALGALGLLCAAVIYVWVDKLPPGNELVVELGERIREGAMVFLRREYTVLAVVVVVVAALLRVAVGTPPAVAFVFGALGALAAGLGGMTAAARADVRAAAAARDGSLAKALGIAFSGGSVTGLLVAALGLLGLGVLYLAFAADAVQGTREFPRFAETVAGFAMGASSIALFARVAGGIYATAAGVGADLASRLEPAVPEGDTRNPALVAGSVGHRVGGVGGAGADLFESYVCAVVAAMAIGATAPTLATHRAAVVALPLLIAMVGLLASLVGIAAMKALGRAGPAAALRSVALVAGGLFLVVAYFVVQTLGITFTNEFGRIYPTYGVFVAILSGTLAGLGIGLVSEYYTSAGPVRRIANASGAGSATNVIAGLAVGMESTAIPVILLSGAVGASWHFAGLYGIAIAAVGMLATVGVTTSVAAFGSIAGHAGGLGGMGHLDPEARKVTDTLHAVGHTTVGVSRGFAVGAAALTALALLSAYASAVGPNLVGIDLVDGEVLIGLCVGGVLPFFVSGLTLTAVGRAAEAVVEEVRRQFREVPDLVEGTGRPDSAACVVISTKAALRGMLVPGSSAVLAPVVVGYFLGLEALGGLLAGATVTGTLLALFMSNAGGAWGNAKRYIEGGALGGKGSDPHRAAAVGDIVGDPLEDAAGPSLDVLMKVMGVVSLVLAPWLVRAHDLDLEQSTTLHWVVETVRALFG